MSRLYVILATAAVALAAVAPASAMEAATTLKGAVGPGFTITLKDSKGKKVTSLKPGKYTFVISDKASIHNFHLTGPGVNKKTSVGGTGTTTWVLTLKKGKYHYQCDPHSSILKGDFRVA